MSERELSSDALERPPDGFAARVSGNYFTLFIAHGFYLPFFPVWLDSQSLTPQQISAIIAAPILARILTMHLAAYADRLEDRATAIIWFSWATAIGFLAMLWMQGFWAILILQFMLALFWNPIMPLVDAINLSGVRRYGFDYGRIRLWGSISFILANFVGGYVLADFPPQALLISIIAAFFGHAIATHFLPHIGKARIKLGAQPLSTEETRALLRRRTFLLVLIASGLFQASHAVLYAFASIYWISLGYSGLTIGALWAISVIAEIILFRFSAPVLLRIGAQGLMYAAGIAGLVRWGLFPYDLGVGFYVLLQVLHGATFGAAHLGIQHYLAETVPEERIGAAQGMNVMIGGLVMAFATFSSGELYSRIGVYAFWLMFTLSLTALLLLVLNQKLDTNVKQLIHGQR